MKVLITVRHFNFILIISIDSNPEMSLSDSYFGYYRPYIEDYFFSEIISIVILVNIFLFKYSKIQLFNLKLIGLLMVLSTIIYLLEDLNHSKCCSFILVLRVGAFNISIIYYKDISF